MDEQNSTSEPFLSLVITAIENGEHKPAVVIHSIFNQFEKYQQHALIHGWLEALKAYQELLYSGETDNLVFDTLTIHQTARPPEDSKNPVVYPPSEFTSVTPVRGERLPT